MGDSIEIPRAREGFERPCNERTQIERGVIERSCLGRTCLHWSADGELTAGDRSLVMQRLAQVDAELTPPSQGSGLRKPALQILPGDSGAVPPARCLQTHSCC